MGRWPLIWRGSIALLLVMAALALWQWTPLEEYMHLAALTDLAARLRSHAWSVPLVILLYVAGGLLFLPLTVLVVATILTFGPVDGFLLANAGTIAVSLVCFGIGHLLGAEPLRRVSGPLVRRLDRRAGEHGMMLVTALRVMPVAHFHIVSLVSGASRIRLRDYCLGTLLGTVPGIFAIAAVGNQTKRFLLDPDLTGLVLLTLIGLASVLALHLLRRWLRRYARTAADD